MNTIKLGRIFNQSRVFILAFAMLLLFVFPTFGIAAESGVTAASGIKQTERPVRDFNQMLKVLTDVKSSKFDKEQVERTNRNFNHLVTGFPLTGAHVIAECSSCHVGGVFKGTSRNCSGCHAKGKRIVATAMPFNHIVTTEPCDICHSNTITFLGARYNHGKAQLGSCRTCHNGLIATGKPSSHSNGLRATESCDGCHRSAAWIPTSFGHARVVPGTCSNCHNSGDYPTGKPANHTSVAKATRACDDCHRTSAWLPASFSHASVTPGLCSTCHNGSSATGKPTSHTSLGKSTYACDSCHTYVGWYPAAYNHSGATACATCHNYTTGMNSTPIKTNHIPTTSACESCHKSYTSWQGATGHTGNEAGRCLECHLAKRPSNHTAAAYLVSCDACHTTTSWSFNHAAQQGKHTCASCHLSKAAKEHGTPTLGSKYYNCDSSGCHTVNSWDK